MTTPLTIISSDHSVLPTQQRRPAPLRRRVLRVCGIGLFGLAMLGAQRSRAAIPSAVTARDLGVTGDPVAAGATTDLTGGNYDVLAGGQGICCAQDRFHFSYWLMQGDFDIRVRVARLDNTATFAMAGLMVRENLTAGSRSLQLVVTPPAPGDNTYKFEFRPAQNANKVFSGDGSTSVSGVPVPNAWMRLVRAGSTLTGYQSTDGTSWSLISSKALTFPETVFVGLATTAGVNAPGVRTTAEYRDLDVTSGTIVPDAVVTFGSLGLEATVRQALNKPAGDITRGDMATLTNLDASNRGITSLSGIEHAVALQTFLAYNNQISDVTLLGSLLQLRRLELQQNQITSIAAVQNLTLLTDLVLYGNQITDIAAMSGLVNLTHVNLSGNFIADFSPLNSLPVLGALFLDALAISDLSFVTGLAQLGWLGLDNNQISDLSPLSHFTQLSNLRFNQNNVSDISVLSPMTTLQTVEMRENFLDLTAGSAAMTVIGTLQGRGATVLSTPQKTLPPGLDSLPARLFFAGQSSGLRFFSAGDPARTAQIASVTAASSNQSVVPDVNVVIGGAGLVRTLQITGATGAGAATITVTVNYSSGSPASASGNFQVTVLATDGSAFLREVYLNVSGGSVASLTSNSKFPSQPDVTESLAALEAPSNYGDDYGQRISGFVVPPVSGNYVFYISSDDQSQLFLSTDDNPANKSQIASEPAWNGVRQWVNGSNQASRGNPPSNISTAIPLIGGQRYYIEGLHKEGGFGDNFGAAWRLPGIAPIANGDSPLPNLPPVSDLQVLFVSKLTGSSQVTVGFNQLLEPASAQTPSNYVLTGATVTGATLLADGKTVLLTVSGFSGSALDLQVNNLTSLAGRPLTVSSITGAVSPLQASDLGTPGDPVEPGASYAVGDGAFDVIAGGSDIWSNTDHGHFTYQQWTGDFDTKVQVVRLDQSGFYAKACLMVRQDLTPGSPNAKIDVNPLTGAGAFEVHVRAGQNEATTGWPAGLNPGPAAIPNAWLRLKREGSTLSAYRSTDGTSWTQLGELDQTFTDPVLVGLATTAQNNNPGQTTVAQYRNYVISVPPPRLSLQASDASASEAGLDPGLFKISLSGDRSQPLTVNYSLSGTAQNGIDFETIGNSVTIPAGQNSAAIPIKPSNDALIEGYEFVTLTLTPPPGFELGATSGTVGLFDDNAITGALKREVYFDLTGSTVNALTGAAKFPNSPNRADIIASLESVNLGDSYGQRLSGLLLPNVTGDYIFYIAADDQAQLWLSTDANPAHKVLIAFEPQWNPSRNWVGTDRRNPASPENRSAPISLEAGQAYFIEVLHKEGGGGDNVAVTWQKPGDPAPANGSDPIGSAYLATHVPVSIASLDPAAVVSGGGDFSLTVNGTGFTDGDKVFWNASGTDTERPTAFVHSRQLTASISAADIASSAEIKTAIVTVRTPGGEVSNASVFTIGSAAVAFVESTVAPPGGSAVVSTAPVTPPDPGEPAAGVTATYNNTGASSAVSVTAATYSTNPNAGTLFDTGGGFVDLQVTGANPADSMAASFYYPPSITGAVEDALVLLFFNGTDWLAVQSTGGSAPAKDATDNLDGTVSGGRFSVLFDNTSTPAITALSGTVFVSTTLSVANDTTPPVPDLATLPTVSGQCSATIAQAPTATDAVTGNVAGTTTDPLTYKAPGTFTVHWSYNDGSGNTSVQTQTVIVQDTIAPLLSGVPANISVVAPSPAGAVVTFASPTALDACEGNIGVICSPVSGSIFPVGTTTVICTAQDSRGNISTASFTVTVAPPALVQLQALISTVKSMSIHPGTKVLLLLQLEAARAALQNNKPQLACLVMRAFELSVKEFKEHNKLTAAQAAQLTTASVNIRAAIGCP